SGRECRLTTNFRSNPAILDGVNGIFAKLIRAQDGVQPRYIAIHAAPGRSAESARRLEGESLARWLGEDVLGKLAIFDARGETVPARARDVAILLRKL